jgi:hypothetical protein
MSNLLKNLLIAVLIAGGLFAGYYFFLRGNNDSLSDVGSNSSTSSLTAEEKTARLLARLELLRTIKIDDSLFSDARFTSLRDFRQDLGQESAGRANPFAPLE